MGMGLCPTRASRAREPRYYAPEGRQRYAFTSVQDTFQEVRDNHWEEVQITLKELDGTLVQFQSNSQCVIQLHFKKD